MGVKGLWRLLLPIGRRISIETLEGQILAIDASIWLTQFLTVAARQREQDLLDDASGKNSSNKTKAYSYDYLVGFLRRLCKLRFQGVRPVLVFDGDTPEIKQRELRERAKRRKRKLGDSFAHYINRDGSAAAASEADDEWLEATRRTAKRILAQQLKTGQLVTKHQHKRLKTMKTAAIVNKNMAKTSYAPGFYDPDAKPVAVSGTQRNSAAAHPDSKRKNTSTQSVTEGIEKDDIDDDHLLRDDYNSDKFQEEVNDWDAAVVMIHSDDDDDDPGTQGNSRTTPDGPNHYVPFRRKGSKKQQQHQFDASDFHAGDGTDFRVDSVADLPESARKDIIEDAQKQRRMASRREFMKVASDPDGLSSCQLRNFLKSTRLNRDITSMAQKASAKAEEEAKLVRGNGILFEKNIDEKQSTTQRSSGGAARQHYRANVGRARSKGNNANRAMRGFHHKHQQHTLMATTTNSNQDGNYDKDDEHDFRKARNNHYLSGGIRFVNSFEDETNDDDDHAFVQTYLDSDNKDLGRTSKTVVTTDHDEGGFAVAVTDGSTAHRSKEIPTRKQNMKEVVRVDSSDSDSYDGDEDAKPRSYSEKQTEQTSQDEALARALQSIEEEETCNSEHHNQLSSEERTNYKDSIEIDESSDDDSETGFAGGGGFLPSDHNDNRSTQLQQEQKDEELARKLQEAEYELEKPVDGGGGFIVINSAETSRDQDDGFGGGGFLVTENESEFSRLEKKSEDGGGGFFTRGQKDLRTRGEDSEFAGAGFLVGEVGTSKKVEREKDSEVSGRFFTRQDDVVKKAPFAGPNTGSELLLCHASSSDDNDGNVDSEDSVDWEDGNRDNNIVSDAMTGTETGKPTAAYQEICALKLSKENSKIPVVNNAETMHGFSHPDSKSLKELIERTGHVRRKNAVDRLNATIGQGEETNLPSKEIESNNNMGIQISNQNETVNSDEDDDDVAWEDGEDLSGESRAKIIDEPLEKEHFEPEKATGAGDDGRSEADTKQGDDAEEDDDDIDWEEGADHVNESKDVERRQSTDTEETNASKIASVSRKIKSGTFDKVDRGVIDCVERNGPRSIDLTLKDSNEAKMLVLHPFPDGDVDETSRQALNKSSKYFDKTTPQSRKIERIDSDDDKDDDDELDWESGTEEKTSGTIGADDWGSTKIQSSDEVAAALEHAQSTAANLTNWAGRAFRRAVAQHAMENGMQIPESAKPVAIKGQANNEIDQDRLTTINGTPSAARAMQGQYRDRTESTKELGMAKESPVREKTIDNSEWLYSVKETITSAADDYMVAPRGDVPSEALMMDQGTTAGGGITDEMRAEVMQLLRLFGIPYIVAPAEAEAQCAELEKLGLVDGIVTEDSDTFVFGGQVVYKNIFDDKKYVEVYHAKDASEEMNLNQDSLVALAMLLGGDYTEGVKGVGIVNGMEILQAFDVAHDCKAGLTRFRKWLDGFDPLDLVNARSKDSLTGSVTGVSTEKEKEFHRKHHTARNRWVAPKHFPDTKVLNAYLNPVVDTSKERFSWGIPDLDGLVVFCRSHMGWEEFETKKLIVPVIQRMEEGSMRQTRIDAFMRYEDGIKFAKIQSKRLREVLGFSSRDPAFDGRQIRKRPSTLAADSSLGELNEETDDERYDNNSESEDFAAANFSVADHDNVEQQIETPRSEWKTVEKVSEPTKKYNGKKTRSIAALSTAAASTTAIAIGSRIGDASEGREASGTEDGATNATTMTRQPVITSLPKTAPPAYQKQSSILEEESAPTTENQSDPSGTTYEVINPSMI